MMEEIIIRGGRPSDLEGVVSVEAACFPAAEAADEKSLRERLEAFGDNFLIAEAGGRIVGFINGSITDSRVIEDAMFEDISLHNPEGDYQSIFGLDVIEAYRHQGLASRLMRELISLARAQGRKGLILTCKEHLIQFYSSFGYVNQGISASVHGGARWYDMILEFKA